MTEYLPEGRRIATEENTRFLSCEEAFGEAVRTSAIVEAKAVLCDYEHNLTVELGFARGIIPRAEGALGIQDGSTRDIAIISRVNKPVCFVPMELQHTPGGELSIILSRREAQRRCRDEYISKLSTGDVIEGRVTHLESFGCFVDIGCGIPSLIPIDQISVSRIAHPSDRFRIGQDIRAVVRSLADGRVYLSHRELLGSWEENAARFAPGQTVPGIIRSVEDYGVFVELAPNLAGLAEPFAGARAGLHASVYIKSILPDRMKIKLIIVDAFPAEYPPPPPEYIYTKNHIDHWLYSTPSASKMIETIFT